MLTLPAHSDSPYYDFEVDLEGRTYIFEFRWNERAAAWFLTLRNAAGEILVAGRKVVINVGLLGRGANPDLPPGLVMAIDTTLAEQDPGRDDLGSRVVVIYRESTEA